MPHSGTPAHDDARFNFRNRCAFVETLVEHPSAFAVNIKRIAVRYALDIQTVEAVFKAGNQVVKSSPQRDGAVLFHQDIDAKFVVGPALGTHLVAQEGERVVDLVEPAAPLDG